MLCDKCKVGFYKTVEYTKSYLNTSSFSMQCVDTIQYSKCNKCKHVRYVPYNNKGISL